MAEIDSTSDKSPIAFYFVDISPWPSDSGLRFSLIHFWEARNTASGHCDARFHFIKLFSALPASTQVISIEKGLYILHTALSPESGLTAGHFS
ncbi:unnamed protein product [Brassica oleracea]|uniref:(rape) hypothetical protein n=1 Tax=Brassica napus TaxID=3708 RepID=A0A816IJP8_BRANA|nr:unnamed protein product [Brassica napus]